MPFSWGCLDFFSPCRFEGVVEEVEFPLLVLVVFEDNRLVMLNIW